MQASATSPSTEFKQRFSQFYLDNQQWLYGYLCKHLSTRSNIDDILQDTFLKIFIRPQLLDQIQQARPYLATTAKNIIINQAQRQKIEQRYLDHLAIQPESVTHSPEQLFIIVEMLDLVTHALSALSERLRHVLIAHYIEGISQVALATQLNVSRKTIQTDLIKAILHCHRQIKQHDAQYV